MKYSTFIIFLLIISSGCFGQISGIYSGKELQSITVYNNGDTVNVFHKKQLDLKPDSTFQFWMTYKTNNSTCYGCSDTIRVSGNWRNIKDTIILNSKYNSEDFIQINGFHTEDSFCTFVYNTPYFCYNSDFLTINDSITLNIECSSISFIKIDTITSVKFFKYIDNTFLFEIFYKPQTYKANFFTINPVHCQRGKFNMSFFENEILLVKSGNLIPLNKNGIIWSSKFYKK